MIIYGSSVSPYVRKVIAFAMEKGIEFKVKVENPGSQDAEFRGASPFGKIPGFRDDDYTLADSSAIVAYLDALRPEPVLIPVKPRERGKVIWWDEFADTILMEAGRKIFFNRIVLPKLLGKPGDLAAADKAEREDLPPVLDYLERSMPDSGWLVGDGLTLADLAVASPFANLRYAGCQVKPAVHPKLASFLQKMHARPSFARSLEKEAKLFAG